MTKIVLLTTETTHHAFFVQELVKYCGEISIYCENLDRNKFPYETFHPFENQREQFELCKWFNGKKISISDLCNKKSFDSLNSPESIRSLSNEKADLVIAFGVGQLGEEVINLFPGKIFNFHGGDPALYRGLDSHLWAIYHYDFSSLITTLHRLDKRLDAGNIVMQGEIEITRGMTIESLRSANTEICVTMALTLIDGISKYRQIPSRKLLNLGRYYSAMPTVLKEICVKRFEKFAKQI
jgi:methionyl-tRNA formyltransferase